mmetsp:Transcript_32056/g.89287  ORF Transcript_32056/g.89287 Transcript_32056/m.89287 type:complete len:168 (+) Transcript_32056:366-869(+)
MAAMCTTGFCINGREDVSYAGISLNDYGQEMGKGHIVTPTMPPAGQPWSWRPRAETYFLAAALALVGLVALAVPRGGPALQQATGSSLYDCAVDYTTWQQSWTLGQKVWCCRKFERGCPDMPTPTSPPVVFDCADGIETWSTGWTRQKRAFCCQNEGKGCDADLLAA